MNVTEFRFLDSNIWVGYFLKNLPETKQIVDTTQTLITSIICIHEVYKKIKKYRGKEEAKEAIEFMEENSIIVNLDRDIAINSVENCEKYSLHTIDSLIYTSAMSTDSLFVTADSDFSRTPQTKIILNANSNSI